MGNILRRAPQRIPNPPPALPDVLPDTAAENPNLLQDLPDFAQPPAPPLDPPAPPLDPPAPPLDPPVPPEPSPPPVPLPTGASFPWKKIAAITCATVVIGLVAYLIYHFSPPASKPQEQPAETERRDSRENITSPHGSFRNKTSSQ